MTRTGLIASCAAFTLGLAALVARVGAAPDTPASIRSQAAAGAGSGQAPVEERARALMRQVPLIDGHNDLPWAMRERARYDFDKIDIRQPQPAMHTDIPRLRRGQLGAQFWSVYVPASLQGQGAVTATLEQIAAVYELVRRYPDTFELARTAADVERIFKAGKIASMMGMEGGHSIDSSLGALRMFRQLGVGYMTLTHSSNVPWADSGTDEPRLGGLSKFGEAVVREMNWLGMLVDLSHVSPDTMKDALAVSEAPVIFSHSSARAICDVPRNVPDDVLRLLPRNGGVVMVSFVPGFTAPAAAEHSRLQRAEMERLRQAMPDATPAQRREAMRAWFAAHPEPKATLAQVADHIDHVRKVAGIDHVGIGSDFDGISSTPEGLEDVSTYPALVVELLRRGYSDEDVKKVLGLNLLRVMREAERVAARLQASRPPSVATIEALDGTPTSSR
jgi:membrane dipeptidase